jgi:hypothetical protein
LFETRPVDIEAKKKIEVVHRFPDVKTFAEVEQQIKDMEQIYLSTYLMTRKVIILKLQTSISDYKVDDVWLGKVIGQKLTDDKITNGNGFIIRWIVAEEYNLDGVESKYNRKLYKIIETSENTSNSNSILNSPPNTLHQLSFYGGGEPRVITYREDLHKWLKGLDGQIQAMLKRLIEFFDLDENKFIQNFESTQLKISAGENNQ